jgi:hypothetical protein
LKALQAVYPEYVPVMTVKPHGYWKDIQNQKMFFDQLAIKWNIQNVEDWNKVTFEMALKEGGHFIGKYYNSSLQQGFRTSVLFLTFKHYKQFTLIMYPQSHVLGTGRTKRIKRSSLIN